MGASSPMETSPPPNPYEEAAAEYSARNESNVWNACYERPAILALLPEISGQRVLDAGCGSGAHSAELRSRGASVIGLDNSAALLRIAHRRLGPDVPLHLADLGDPLPLPEADVDVVLASLVMHYLQDWTPTLREFHRVLRPGGTFVMSTHHPFLDYTLSGSENYFAHEQWSEPWTFDDKTVTMRFWRRPLHAILDALTNTGFTLTRLSEPQPLPEVRDRDPRGWKLLTTQPRFLFLAARRD
nr:class I SAM-dependent methyltransferase [Parafrankia sp. Ea1.12]